MQSGGSPIARRSDMRLLVTGGAGFIGTRLLPRLASICEAVAVYDNLLPQVHGENAPDPPLPDGTAFIRGDIRDKARLARLVSETRPDLIIHLAAETGTGQSYDEVTRYCEVNVSGTAHLAEAVRALPRPAGRRRVVLTSSRAVYGEGAYLDNDGRLVVPRPRSSEDLARRQFALADDAGTLLTPIATSEPCLPSATSTT